MQETYDIGKRSLLSLICHGSTLFGATAVPILGPIAIMFLSDDPIVKANAKESINFHLNIWFWATVILGIYNGSDPLPDRRLWIPMALRLVYRRYCQNSRQS
jgi:hypothetical protein